VKFRGGSSGNRISRKNVVFGQNVIFLEILWSGKSPNLKTIKLNLFFGIFSKSDVFALDRKISIKIVKKVTFSGKSLKRGSFLGTFS